MPCDYDRIRADNIKEYGQGTRHLAFLSRLYTDRTHFVFELLQNAEDAGASQVQFRLLDSELEVRHNGRPFDERDVRGVCGVGEGTGTEDLTRIGKFGIGFKSVYAYTSTPEVHCGGEHFRIENYVRPFSAAARLVGDSYTTLFVLPFNAPGVDSATASSEIATRLRNLKARTLLFLRNIREIEYQLPDETGGVYLRDEKVRDAARQVTVMGQNDGRSEDEDWLVFERAVQVPDGSKRVRVELAFRLETDAEDHGETIVRIKDSPLVVFFPTEKPTRFGFLVQGPYRTTPARDNIPKDDEWNETLVEESAHLVVDALRGLKEMGLVSVPLLEALPIRMVDFPEESMLHPIVRAVRDALLNEEFLPADDGTLVSARHARLASAEWLRSLLREEQLRQLFKTDEPLKWVSGEITERARHDLWKYLRDHLEIEEVTPDSFARKSDLAFFTQQTDEWMVSYYTALGNHRALWKRGSTSCDPPGPLRAKPFLRLEDGSHVRPFRDDASPCAYLAPASGTETTLPIIRTAISQDEGARRFLADLGIPELDIIAEVIERVLPKYSSSIPIDEHWRDMRKIVQAYRTDSYQRKWQLKERLRQTPFILAETPLGTTSYRRPCDVYFRSDELAAYFAGNNAVGFVVADYAQPALELFKDLGVADTVRIHKTVPNNQGHVPICDWHGRHKRGLQGFDPDIRVDGLDHAIANPTRERSLIIWNSIAIPNSACIRGTVETSTRQTYQNSSTHSSVSKFGQSLIDTAWLPRRDGTFAKPSELRLDDLPESFIRDEKLADQLGIKKDVVAKLAEQAGVQAEDIELLKQHPAEFQAWKATIIASRSLVFPTRTVANPEHRREHLLEQLACAPKKEYEPHQRTVRVTEGSVDPTLWLRNQYTNEAGLMLCQICQKEMPFRKRNGEYYFEAVEALSSVCHFSKEHEAQHLALCPLCAAMYKEFVKQDEDAMEALRNALVDSEEPQVPLQLGELSTRLRFVESHFQDIKTILEMVSER